MLARQMSEATEKQKIVENIFKDFTTLNMDSS